MSMVREISTNPNVQCTPVLILVLLPFYTDFITESQNLRVVEVGVDIWKSFNPTPLLGTGSAKAGCPGLCSVGL